MKITQHAVGDVTVLTPAGRIVTEDGDALRLIVDSLILQGRAKIVLDLQKVTYIDSSGLGLMVSKYVSARRYGGDIKLLHLSERSLHLLDITHLTDVFESFELETDAIRAFETSSVQAHTV